MNGLCICSEASDHIVIPSIDDDMGKLLWIERNCERIQRSRSSTTATGNYCYYDYYYYRMTYM